MGRFDSYLTGTKNHQSATPDHNYRLKGFKIERECLFLIAIQTNFLSISPFKNKIFAVKRLEF